MEDNEDEPQSASDYSSSGDDCPSEDLEVETSDEYLDNDDDGSYPSTVNHPAAKDDRKSQNIAALVRYLEFLN